MPKQHGLVEDPKTVAPLKRRPMSLQRENLPEISQITRLRRIRIREMNTSSTSPDGEEPSCHVAEVLQQVSNGDQAAADLLPLVYDHLRVLAQQRMMLERPGHTLQATALVHEVFLKLAGPREIPWAGQAHFYAAAAEAMRRILVDHARGRNRQKRIKAEDKILINVLDLADAENSDEILALDEAFCRLEQQEPEVGQVVRLRFFAGLSIDQRRSQGHDGVSRRFEHRRQFLHLQSFGKPTAGRLGNASQSPKPSRNRAPCLQPNCRAQRAVSCRPISPKSGSKLSQVVYLPRHGKPYRLAGLIRPDHPSAESGAVHGLAKDAHRSKPRTAIRRMASSTVGIRAIHHKPDRSPHGAPLRRVCGKSISNT